MEIDLSDLFSDVNKVNDYLKANSNIGEDLNLNDVFDRLEAEAMSGCQARDRVREVVQEQIIQDLGLTKKEEKVSPALKSDLLKTAVKPSKESVTKSDLVETIVKSSITKESSTKSDLLETAAKPSVCKESATKNKRKVSRKPHIEAKKIKICKFASLSLFDDTQNIMATNENKTAPEVKNDKRMAISSIQKDGNITESQFRQKPNVAELICNDKLKLTTPKHMSDKGAIKNNVNPGDEMGEAFIVVSDNSDDEDDLAVVGMVGPINKDASVIAHPSSSSASVDTVVSSKPSDSGSTSSSSTSSSNASVAPTNAAISSETSLKSSSPTNAEYQMYRIPNLKKRKPAILRPSTGESSIPQKSSSPTNTEYRIPILNKVKLAIPRPSTGGSSIPLKSSSPTNTESVQNHNANTTFKIIRGRKRTPNKVKPVIPRPSTGGSSIPLDARHILDISSSPGPSKAPPVSNIVTRSKSVENPGNSSSAHSVTNIDEDIRAIVAKKKLLAQKLEKLEDMFPHFSPEYLLETINKNVTIENAVEELLSEVAAEASSKVKDEEMKRVKEHVAKSLILLGEKDMFKKVTLTEKREFNPEDPLENKFRLAKGHYLSVSGQLASPIESIDYVENRALMENFERRKSEFRAEGKDTREYFLFHGTNNVNVDSILNENFRMDLAGKHGQAHGRGIYFSEKTIIPNQYMNGAKKTLLLCRVLLGREFLGLDKDIPKGFDSKSVQPDQDKRANINIIKEVDQILPCFVLNLAASSGPGQNVLQYASTSFAFPQFNVSQFRFMRVTKP